MVSKGQLRSSKKLTNVKKQRKKYPDLLSNIVETSDIILQILDARFIEETRNKDVEEAIQKKGRKILYVLNKADLVDKDKIKKSGLNQIRPYVFISSIKRTGGKELRDKIKYLSKTITRINPEERVAVGVIGYPNTGKSSVINLLIGKASAKTGSKAGFTKGVQKLRLSKDIILIDSPGVIPEKEYSNVDQLKMSQHTMVGARDYNKIKDPEITISKLIQIYQKPIEDFYNIKIKDTEDLIEHVGRKKNILKKGNEVNSDQVARKIIKDWQEGKIKIY